MLAKDPVKRDQNRYRYCDNDPADYVDPTGEIANIVGGALLGGGFLSSVVSQKMSGGEIDWWKALGAGINGLITGATQGGLLASGAGIPAALFGNNLAGTAGSAAEQGIGSGKIDPVKSIIDGLSNAVGNRWYKSDGLKSAKDAFKRGAGSGAIISGLNYISDTLFQKPEQRGMGVGLLPGIAGAAFSPYNFLRNPRRGCGSTSPFVPGLGYSSARGYQYDLPKIENGSQSLTKKFSLKDLLLEMAIGGVTGGVSSAAFYGAGKGIERLKEGLRPSKGKNAIRYRIGNSVTPMEKSYEMALNPELYANEIADKYGINLKGSGQKIHVLYNPELASHGRTKAVTPNIIELGRSAFVSEDELANTIAHELNHARSFLKGGNAPEWGAGGAYPAGNALSEYIRGER